MIIGIKTRFGKLWVSRDKISSFCYIENRNETEITLNSGQEYVVDGDVTEELAARFDKIAII